MPFEKNHLYLELFGEREAVHPIAALLHECVYEEIRPFVARSVVEVEAQLNAFREGVLAGGQLNWIVRDQRSHSCLGGLQATLKGGETVVVGYRIRSEEQNKGIATAALGLLVQEISIRWPTFQIAAKVHPENIASLQVLKKANFVPTERAHDSAFLGDSIELFFRYRPSAENAV